MKKVILLLLLVISLFMFTFKVSAETNVNDTNNTFEIEEPKFDIDNSSTTCSELLGSNLVLVVKFGMNAIRIIGVIVAIVKGMTTLLPAVNKGDAGELNKAIRKCIWIAVVLIIIVMFPTLARVIGKLFGFDTSCI